MTSLRHYISWSRIVLFVGLQQALGTSASGYAPPEDFVAALRGELDSQRSGQARMQTAEIASLVRQHGLALIEPYVVDASPLVRGQAAAVVGEVLPNAGADDRESTIELLVGLVIDHDAYVSRVAYRGLAALSSADFTGAQRRRLVSALGDKSPTPSLVLACGLADAREAIPKLREIEEQWIESGNVEKLAGRGWFAELALARLGDEERLAAAIRRVTTIADAYRRAAEFEDLEYVRQRPVIPVLLEALLSNTANIEDHDAVLRSPSQLAAIALSKMLLNFPVPARPAGLTPDELEQVRAWARMQTNWQLRR